MNKARRLLSRDEVEQEYGLSKRVLAEAAVRGDGPPMVRVNRKVILYRREDLEAWIAARIVASTSDEIAGAA